MSANVLVDTNILVYAYDRSTPEKQSRALQVLDALVSSGAGALTTQVLAEFYVAVTRKIPAPLNAADAYERVHNLQRAWTVLPVTPLVVLEAARGVRDHQMSYWDAQVWAAARLNQIPTVCSEDLAGAPTIEGVSFVNPFSPGFRVEEWVGRQRAFA